MTEKLSSVRIINRVCGILNSFNDDQHILSLAEISNKVGIPKTTAHRLIEALVIQGVLIHDHYGRGYLLGYKLINWGALAQSSIDIRNISLPVLRSLSETTGETAILAIRQGNMGICVEKIESKQPVRLTMDIGKRLHIHAGSTSKVLLAFLNNEKISKILESTDMIQITKNTITSPQDMWNEINEIRHQGYAISWEETDEGAMGVSAPIYDHQNYPVAGISIIAPTNRISNQQIPALANTVVQASAEISKQLGATK